MLDDIVRHLESVRETGTPIPAARVREWMKAEDTDSRGATYALLVDPAKYARVSPALSFEEVFDFVLRYYEFCLRNDPDSRWADSRWSAGSEMVRWFVSMWDEKRERRYCEAVKRLLESLYKSGSAELRKCVEQAVMEHLFERKPIRAFFADWRDNSELKPAYDEAMLWVSHGGSSPLVPPDPGLRRRRRRR